MKEEAGSIQLSSIVMILTERGIRDVAIQLL